MSEEKNIERLYFEPSTLETIDRSVHEYIKNLNLQVETNKGSIPVPVLWGTSERAFLSKKSQDERDQQGALIFPAISIKRNAITKPQSSPGVFVGNVLEVPDYKGGAFEISKILNQAKTSKFANADAKKITGQENYPRSNKKRILKIITMPVPVNIEVTYEITIRTDFQQQINDLIFPFITSPGTVRAVLLRSGDHKYEGFFDNQYQSQDNLTSFENEERKFETKISLRVVGYLVGHDTSRKRPYVTVRENIVELKLPRERTMLSPEEMEKYNL